MSLFLDSEQQLNISKNFNNQGIKYRPIQFLKTIIFLAKKKQWKSRHVLHESFFSPQYICASGDPMRYFKIKAHLFCCPLFFKEYLNLKLMINKVLNKYIADPLAIL